MNNTSKSIGTESKPYVTEKTSSLLKWATDKISGTKDSENVTANPAPKAVVPQSHETATQEILGKIFSVPSDSKRGILMLNDADLKDRYLTKGGEKKLADAFTDAQIAAIFPHARFTTAATLETTTFTLVGSDFDLGMIKSSSVAKRPYAVLFNIKNSVASHFSTLSPSDFNMARIIFAEAISHPNYVLALNGSAIRKANIGTLKDREQREELFNITKFVASYPVRAVIDAARDEQSIKDEQRAGSDRDKSTDDNDSSAPSSADVLGNAPTKTLSPGDRKLIDSVASKARRIALAREKDWPTDEAGFEPLRNSITGAMKNSKEIVGKEHLLPEIIKAFYANASMKPILAQVKALLGEPPASPAGPKKKTPDDTAAEILASGDDFAQQVAAILAAKKKK